MLDCINRWLVLCLVLGCSQLSCSREQSARSSSPNHEDRRPPTGDLTFVDVTSTAGLTRFRHDAGSFGKKWFPESVGAGAAFIDFDGDRWLDILLVGGGVWPDYTARHVPALRLYRNNADGTFTEVTDGAGLADVEAYGMGLTVADYDNDGDEDFYFTTVRRNRLFRNEGGSFVDVTRDAGLASAREWSTCSIFFDGNRDGHLDLYVCNYVDWSPKKDIWCSLDGQNKSYCTPEAYNGVPGRYYRNRGDGTFADRTDSAGFRPAPGNTLGVAEWDFNDDGWPDLVVANDKQPNLLYENNGDGTFTDVGRQRGVALSTAGVARAGMGVDVGDINNDGHATIAVGNFSHEQIGFFQQTGNGFFIDRARTVNLGEPTIRPLTFGLFLFDVDLDGDLDLFLANGHVQEQVESVQYGITYRQRPQLFLYEEGKDFQELSAANGDMFGEPLVARGSAYGDYDRDGDLDILVTENDGPVHLWQNNLRDRHFLRIHLEGRESNADGLGAHVIAVVDERRIRRRVRTGSSYLSHSETALTIGLGSTDRIDSLLVRWPSGITDSFGSLRANRSVIITEGESTIETARK